MPCRQGPSFLALPLHRLFIQVEHQIRSMSTSKHLEAGQTLGFTLLFFTGQSKKMNGDPCFLLLSKFKAALQNLSTTPVLAEESLAVDESCWRNDVATKDSSFFGLWRNALATTVLFTEYQRWTDLVWAFRRPVEQWVPEGVVTRPLLQHFLSMHGLVDARELYGQLRMLEIYTKYTIWNHQYDMKLFMCLLVLCRPVRITIEHMESLLKLLVEDTPWIDRLRQSDKATKWFEVSFENYRGRMLRSFTIVPPHLERRELQNLEAKDRLRFFHDYLPEALRPWLYLLSAFPNSGAPALVFELAHTAQYNWWADNRCREGTKENLPRTSVLRHGEDPKSCIQDLEPVVDSSFDGSVRWYWMRQSDRQLVWTISKQSHEDWILIARALILRIFPKISSWYSRCENHGR
ncbi:hypothetical protein BDZ85DRAFT_33014 [Elsinoe ampelina]|uniref:Uncharacterized protein n=1 Tax=Elsinoe ampelina TaxID=302913 RepID=A0A6A6G373_9PEZI|nr:hypothetical protein BDZ85DRAFT_33014 [Elsinoe ampelina]